MNKNLLIIGAGGHGQVVKEVAEAMNQFDQIDFLDDTNEEAIGRFEDYETLTGAYYFGFVAIGNNGSRSQWLTALKQADYEIPVLIHPTAYISPSAIIEEGTIVEAKAVVNTKAMIHRGSIIDIGAIVDHDAVIEDCCHVDCGAIVKAYVRVEREVKVKAGLVVKNTN